MNFNFLYTVKKHGEQINFLCWGPLMMYFNRGWGTVCLLKW